MNKRLLEEDRTAFSMQETCLLCFPLTPQLSSSIIAQKGKSTFDSTQDGSFLVPWEMELMGLKMNRMGFSMHLCGPETTFLFQTCKSSFIPPDKYPSFLWCYLMQSNEKWPENLLVTCMCPPQVWHMHGARC